MSSIYRICLVVFASGLVALSQAQAEDIAPAERMHAAWKVVQPDGLGDVYYLYPDGLFVRQGVRRREFVAIGHWRVEEGKRIEISDLEPRNTTLTAEALAAIKAKKETFDLEIESEEKMRWVSTAEVKVLQRIRDLPDRTENPYWGLGTDEDYQRGIRRELGLPNKEKKESNQSAQTTPVSAPR